ncbi:zinc-binding dehydrogenase [Polymorphobacter sp. PAMC 29334]|uniref:zinc-binding dehydrogenase n=1 Tax=Polymorphobacter sp. PAMC 29334 TaxID=2862331 RepID=UPI001C749ADC|nr:zinc-binding dehydrogenase [Polymorphobacter sp. PAMC 29334]QYE36332.1 zinc-binding dehydrogenase [Polymorphobacter sp. PAMC 29334]
MDYRQSPNLSLRTKVSSDRLEVSLEEDDLGEPQNDEIVVRVEASPVNPSDLGLIFGAADPRRAIVKEAGGRRRLVIPLDERQAGAMAARRDLSLCPGLEGAGTVVDASKRHEALIGRTVAIFGGGMYSRFRRISVDDCLLYPEGTAPASCASSFVNPLTVLGFLETMRDEGHKALVHTAAASNLGQMLVKVCLADGIDLISIVRSPEQARLLEAIGAKHVLNSKDEGFRGRLKDLVRETGATLGFDAIGGGPLACDILTAMERAFTPKTFSMYGSVVNKQVYVYGMLDSKTIEIRRTVGAAWGVGGWLMMNRMAALGSARVDKLKQRVVREIDTSFRSNFNATIGLEDMVDPELVIKMIGLETGAKYLLDPSLNGPRP